MDIKEDQQVQFIGFFTKKTGAGTGVNEELAQELHKPVIKKVERRKGLKIIFGQQIQLK